MKWQTDGNDASPARRRLGFPGGSGWGGVSVRVGRKTLDAPTVSVIVVCISAGTSALTRSVTVAPSASMSGAQHRCQDVVSPCARLGADHAERTRLVVVVRHGQIGVNVATAADDVDDPTAPGADCG